MTALEITPSPSSFTPPSNTNTVIVFQVFLMSKIIIRPKYPLTCLLYMLYSLSRGGNVRFSVCMIKVYARSVFIIILVIWAIYVMVFLLLLLPALRNCGLKGILSASRHHFMEDVQKLNIVHYHTYWTLIHSLGRNRSPEKKERETYSKKGDFSTSILLCLCLWCHFDYFILVQL